MFRGFREMRCQGKTRTGEPDQTDTMIQAILTTPASDSSPDSTYREVVGAVRTEQHLCHSVRGRHHLISYSSKDYIG